MKHAKDFQVLFVGSAIGTQQNPRIDLVDLGGIGHVPTRGYLTHDTVARTQKQPASLVRQRTNARRENGVSLSGTKCEHVVTLVNRYRFTSSLHYAGYVARARQIRERRAKKRDEAGSDRVVATNRRARHDFEIIDTLECGLVLTGSEVKSLREGTAQIAESYARVDNDELWIFQMHIPPWRFAVGFGSHDPDRKRKLLVHRKEITKWEHEVNTQSLTIVPLKLYFKDGRAKVEIALARGRKQQDRRQALAKRDAERDMARAARHVEKFG